jgi:DNA-binding transcriptional ArsR family regulator
MRKDDFALVWKALAEPIRRQILDLVRERPYTTGELAETLDISRYAVMKHLSNLEHSGLITVHRQGRERWNHLNPAPLQMIYERWLRPYEATWANALLQLKEIVEAGKPLPAESKPGAGWVAVDLAVTIDAAPSQVFDAMTQNLSAWWGAPYLYGDAKDIVLEPKVGGRLYEVWGQDAVGDCGRLETP